MFQLDKIIHLRSALENKFPNSNKQNDISIVISRQKTPKDFKFPK